MAVFHYVACNADGRMREGELEACSSREAAQIVRGQALRVIRIGKAAGKKNKRFAFRSSPVTRKHAAFFCRQLAVMVDSQPIHEILSALSQQGGDKAYQAMIRDLRASVELGHSLAESLKKYEQAFSANVIHLIAAGEASGNLSEILSRLADYLEKEYAAKQKFQSMMFYPLILAVAALAALFVMLVFLLPSFADLLEGMHVPLPLPTRILLFLRKFLAECGHWTMLGGAASVLGCWILYGKEYVRRPLDALLLRLPFWGTLKLQTAWMQILGTLSVLLGSGLRMDEALSMVGNVTGNLCLQSLLSEARQSVQHGYSLAAALQGRREFPPMLLQLIAAGERSGCLEEMLQKSADYCRISAEAASQRLQAMMEPALILVMGGVVIFFVLAIVLPMLDSMSAIS